METIIKLLSLALVYTVLFGCAEYLYHKKKTPVESTRKIVHFGSGLLAMSFPFLFASHWTVLLLCLSFIGILEWSKSRHFLPSIHQVKRKTKGALLFPIIAYSCFLFYQNTNDPTYYYLPLLLLTVSDSLAAIAGKKWPRGQYSVLNCKKTLIGSLAFFISAILITYGYQIVNGDSSIQDHFLMISTMAFATTLAEAIGVKGYDNLFIPASAMIVLSLFEPIVNIA